MNFFQLLFFWTIFQFSYQVSVKQLGACFPNKYGDDAECYHRMTNIDKNKTYTYQDAIDACKDPDNLYASDLNGFLPMPSDEEEFVMLRRVLYWQNINGPIYLKHPQGFPKLEEIYQKHAAEGSIEGEVMVYDPITNTINSTNGEDELQILCQRRRTAKVFCPKDFHLFPNTQACFAHFGSFEQDGNIGSQVRYSFNKCQRQCKEHKSQIATFDSNEEYRLMKKIGDEDTWKARDFFEETREFIGSVNPKFGTWIGIRLPATVGQNWKGKKPQDIAYYMDGSNVRLPKDVFLSLWARGEPSNGDLMSDFKNSIAGSTIVEHCVQMFPHHDKGWNDEDCKTEVEGCACRAMADRL